MYHRLLILMFGMVFLGCEQIEKGPPKVASSGTTNAAVNKEQAWTTEDAAKNPEGYYQWADKQLEVQIAHRESSLARIAERIHDIRQRGNAFNNKQSALENLNKRLRTALRKAEEEDRWPIKIAGESFERDRAKAYIEATERTIAQRKPLAQSYEQALRKLAGAEKSTKEDVHKLQQLKEKLSLDLERIRVTKGIEELGILRQTETEISSMTNGLSTVDDSVMDGEAIDEGSVGDPKERIDIEALIK